MKVDQLAAKASLEFLNRANTDAQIEGGYAGDLLSWVMGNAKKSNVWVTIMTNRNIIAVASLLELSCIVIAEASEIDDEVVALAAEKGVNLLRSPKPVFELCSEISALIS